MGIAENWDEIWANAVTVADYDRIYKKLLRIKAIAEDLIENNGEQTEKGKKGFKEILTVIEED
jgi:hypothetical protein